MHIFRDSHQSAGFWLYDNPCDAASGCFFGAGGDGSDGGSEESPCCGDGVEPAIARMMPITAKIVAMYALSSA
ncbi:MAG: hypothetical protein PF961_07185 [Planctomycetota bacterium]|jgi:hypothetical protein|nr:hypothetical protein [Planctomycetota bacterium]